MSTWHRIGQVIGLLVWILVASYFAMGGWAKIDLDDKIDKLVGVSTNDETPVIKNDVQFASVAHADTALRQRNIYRLFPFTRVLPTFACLFLAAAAFGALGGVTRLLKSIVLDHKPLAEQQVLATPLFGALLGLMLLGLAYIIPAAVATTDEIRPRLESIMILCLVGGLLSGRLYKWIERRFDKLIGKTE